MSELSAAIRTRGLRKSYNDKPAVQGLDLEVGRGEFFGFLGPNGAGKTTTIHILTGVITASAGEVEVLGMKVPEDIHQVKRQIGVVPDENVLFDRLTGYEFLEFAGRMYGLDRDVAAERARELMGMFELDMRQDTLIAGYSKGMKKRVALGAALIHRPQLYLLDEPFEGVDPVGARLMKKVLLQQVEQGATVFLTSHVLEVVERLCRRVAIIEGGRIVAEGEVSDLRTAEETLEDIFLRVVGGEAESAPLAWL